MDFDYLKELLNNVNDSYGDFVFGIILKMERYGNKKRYDELVKAIKENPNITTSEIIVMTQYPEIPEVVIVDDDEEE